MVSYLVGRVIQAVITIFCVVTGTFLLVRTSGDPVAMLLPLQASAEDIASLRTELGLDRSLPVQYVRFLWQLARGDLGQSLRSTDSAIGLVLDRLPATIELALSAFVFGVGLALLIAIALQLSGSTRFRNIVLWIAAIRQAIPVFWFGLILVLIFSLSLGWLPSIGRGGISHLILPAATLGTYEVALYLRLFDSAMDREAQQDYVRMALAKGQTRGRVIIGHLLPNALLPLITVAGLNLGYLLGGAVVTETVFSWPGAGRLVLQAVNQRDYPVVIAGILMMSVMFVMVNFVVDLLYAVLDPRVRLA